MNQKGGIAIKLVVLIIIVICGCAFFMPVTDGMKTSAAKGLLSCPSQIKSMAEKVSDGKLTYAEYIQFRMACASK